MTGGRNSLRLDIINRTIARAGVPPARQLLAPRTTWPACLLVLALLLAACGPQGLTPAVTVSPTALQVVTTTTVLADIVQNVGGDRVTTSSIIPPGVGPEDYEPKPEDAKLLTHAGLIVSNGVGLDGFLDKLLTSGTGGATPQLVLGDGIPTIDIDGQPNPHLWLDPTLVKRYYVPAISAKLAALDPADAATFSANAQAYSARLDALDAELSAKVAQIPPQNRKLVTFHDAFPYLARHYGFELVGVILANVGQEPSAAELASLVETVKAAGVKAVFSEAQFSPKLAQTLAEEAGITKVVTTLYNDALGPPPADTYLGMMRYDMDQIVQALT
jgi:manganese/iron transport system substrate-binding protein